MEALNLAGPVNLELIHLDEPRERAYWAHVLSVSEDELERIVDRVGPRAIEVRHHLIRARHAEWQRRLAHQPQHRIAPTVRASADGPVFGLIVCGVAAVATTFGALAYGLLPPDEWTVFQREHGCELAANSDPKIEQVALQRCIDATNARHACRRDRTDWLTIWEICPKRAEAANAVESEP